LIGPDGQLRFFTVRDKQIGTFSMRCRAINLNRQVVAKIKDVEQMGCP
jgi:hypothetical protein